jgi:hypothetical protein
MKKLLLLVYVLLIAISGKAQMFSMPQGTTNNIFPFGSNTNNKVQWLYLPTNFSTPPPPGTITRVYFKTWNNLPSYTATYSNFSIRMLNTAINAFPNSTFVTGATTVFTGNPVVVPTTGPYTWFSFTLTTPFVYTGQNIIVEIEQNNMLGQIYANCTNAAGNQRLWGTYGSATAASTPDNNIGDFGIDMLLSCDSPINFVKNVTRFTADISWDPRVGASQYEYLIDQSPLDPPSSGYAFTNTPSVGLKNLPDGTCYYIHVRTICGSSMMSGWSLDSFCTIKDCYTPVATIDNITSKTAVASWDPVPGATGYEYSVATTPDTPTSGHKTSYTSVKLQGLWPNKPLYFFVKAYCSPTPSSPWGTTPFHTMAHTGVEDVAADNSVIEAWPNPVKDMVTIRVNTHRSANAQLILTDVTGRVVYSTAVTKGEVEIDMADFAPGMYLAKYADEINTSVIKLTKQ